MMLIAGNWKMNGLRSDLQELRLLGEGLCARDLKMECVVCPPATLAAPAAEVLAGGPVSLGGQDCHTQEKGAHTGEISAIMWADIGAEYVIVGHSERRCGHGESSVLVASKAQAAIDAGLTAIVCIGESLEERQAGRTEEILKGQLLESLRGLDFGRVVLAYEPVWAIGTGLTPQSDEITATHAMLKQVLAGMDDSYPVRILYGGSVNPKNARSILSLDNVDGVLVGGASLKAGDFLSICCSVD